MFNSDTQTVVLVINVRVSALNVHLVYENCFRGPLALGGPRQLPTFAYWISPPLCTGSGSGMQNPLANIHWRFLLKSEITGAPKRIP